MPLFRSKPTQDATSRKGLLEDLERMWRRARVFLLAGPLLLFSGYFTGNLTKDALALPFDDDGGEPVVRLDALSNRMELLRTKGLRTEESVGIYQEHVAPVERVLRRRGVPSTMARTMAWPLVEEAYRNRLDVATVISVISIESNFRPKATSTVGARGLMQIMPLWEGYWGGCRRDLYDIEGNLCTGTRILAYYLRRNGGDERRALLGYNGCVKGTNTPNCHTYPDKIARVRRQVSAELVAARSGPRPGAAASR
jgi:hypothetical protein